MIPPIIHYCWFSGEEMPPLIQKCVASWKRIMPGCELRLWDMDAVRDIPVPFLQEALAARKWAFAADFVRVYAVEKYGGIYLDTDVELLKPLDPFMTDRAFFAREELIDLTHHYIIGLSSHAFGAEPHHPFIRRCVEYYHNRHFITSPDVTLPDRLRMDFNIMPMIQAMLAVEWGYDLNTHAPARQHLRDGLEIYPVSYFPAVEVFSDTFAVHSCCGSWSGQDASTVFRNIAEPRQHWLRALVSRMNLLPVLKKLLNRLGYRIVRI